MFNTDKKAYTVGDKVTVELPATHSGRALVSLETGSKVLQNFWIEPTKDNSKFSFTVTPEMSPNVYIHISYIQAHNTKNNDFPIRMYGVQAIKIDDPATRLQPVIQMNKELKPEQKFSVKVKEANGKPMTYTIAIVDDGILDLTRFKTPNPWDAFYAQEALGVRTWDMYKYVAGAFTGKIAGLLAIGGDEFEKKKGKENNNRFKPVVLYKGPFTCKAGETKTHDFTMPNYVGSVRVMIVATEHAVVLYRDKLPKFNNNGKMIFNWFKWERDGKEYPKLHPTQKPVNILKTLIEIFTDEGDVVIDPVAGSGTTLRAAY
ncbi:MAG TPA: DNA methyltransferase, partial [Bacteroidales bacterium]|nr:DNA methyltransferase [Bacteroidales bacterium]